MNDHVYDRSQAERLVPLLRAITQELRERNEQIDELDARVEQSAVDSHPTSTSQLRLRLLEHRRALALAERELAALGCMLDEDHPLRVLIPGGGCEYAFDALHGRFETNPLAGIGG
jgi:hypothetical protein